MVLASRFQQAIYSLNGMYVGSKGSQKCYHLNVSLVDHMREEFRLDLEPFGLRQAILWLLLVNSSKHVSLVLLRCTHMYECENVEIVLVHKWTLWV